MEQAAGGRTLCDELAATAERWGGEPALSDTGDNGPWHTITWAQARQQGLERAAGLIDLGLQPGERGALMLPHPAGNVRAALRGVDARGGPCTLYRPLA